MQLTPKSKPPVMQCLSALQTWRMQTLSAAECLSDVRMPVGAAEPHFSSSHLCWEIHTQ